MIRTRFLILSDTHSAERCNYPHLIYSKPFPSADVAIHCGDLTSSGKLEEHTRALMLLRSLPAPLKIVIPGNHDLTLDEEYCGQHSISRLHGWTRSHTRDDIESANAMYTNDEALQAGIVYLTEGTQSFTLKNGAKLNVYASAYTPEFCDWGFPYPRTRDRFNPDQAEVPRNPIPTHIPGDSIDQIHVILTHGPPWGVLDETVKGDIVGCKHLARAVEGCRPLLHCFGHIHEGWGTSKITWPKLPEESQAEDSATVSRHQHIDEIRDANKVFDPILANFGYRDGTSLNRGTETIFVNASVMDYHYNPCQAPWIVDLMLPVDPNQAHMDE